MPHLHYTAMIVYMFLKNAYGFLKTSRKKIFILYNNISKIKGNLKILFELNGDNYE